MSSANSDSFSLFPFSLDTFYFFFLFAIARISSNMLNKSSESKHPCHVSEFSGRLPAFHCWVWCWLWICLKWPLIMLRTVSSLHTVLSWMDNSIESYVSFEIIIWYLSFFLFMWCIIFFDLQMSNHPCDLRINSAWSWCMILFMYCWFWFVNIFCWGFLYL